VRDAPAIGKLLQAMTLYGLVDAMRGPGLGFARLIAPFSLSPDLLVLGEARAYSASLGLTAKGRIDRRRNTVDMEGTIVPAYVFNSLLGNIPIFGRLFSPETGGGLFAASYRVQGPLGDPQVMVNPLTALTPGFLRGLFGVFEQGQR
jgi:AsmA-like C-terminal region